MKKNKEKCACGCGEDLEKEEKNECNCGGDCGCGEGCTCEPDCNCTEDNKCNENCTCGEKPKKDYLEDLLRVQAEFDNYRKRMVTSLGEARTDGFIEAITGFLPALDSFKMASDMITDKNTLMGIKFIEKGILDTLSKMGVEQIDTTGKFNPEFHHAIDSENQKGYESGDIIRTAYNGFTYKGKVIRYAQVIVQK